tara:strand:- start:432 stop:1094 length:663 start_codon:yes stop_codon:yes gene_type:complete
MTVANSNQSFGLRYMQLDISRETAHELPGVNVTDSIKLCEFVSCVSSNETGMVCFLKVSFDDPKALENANPAFELLEVISQTKNAALIKAQTLGPLPRVFSSNEEVWWISPTYVNRNGMKITLKGTRKGMRSVREELFKLVGNGYKVKLGSESIHNPEFIDLLPEKQRAVLNKAVEMGYYNRPRKCTQRDIAREMNVKQATISEHLQSAESKIINSLTIP